MAAIVDLDPNTAGMLHAALGQDSVVLPTMDALRRHLETQFTEDAVVLGPNIDLRSALDLAGSMRVTRPSLGVILVRRRVDTSVLADAMRAGIFEVVEERDLAGLTAAVRRCRELARALRETVGGAQADGDGSKRGVLVTVFSAKGGCGKTTVATNLAAALADGGRHQVCLVDLDLAFGDVAIALQLFPAHTIADAVPLAGNLDAQALASLLTPHSPGLTTLVAPVEPGHAESIPATLVTTILELLKQSFEYVVVDTPPAFDDHVLAAFDQSDLVALMATLDIPALKNLKLTLETLELLNYPRERWRDRPEPVGLQGRARAVRGREDAQGPDQPAGAELPRRPGIDQPRRPDRPGRPQAPGEPGHQGVRRAPGGHPGRLRIQRHPAGAAHRPAQRAAKESEDSMSLADRLAAAQRDRVERRSDQDRRSTTPRRGPAASSTRSRSSSERCTTHCWTASGPSSTTRGSPRATSSRRCARRCRRCSAQDHTPLTGPDRARLAQEIADDILGYGPLEPYLRDPDVTEVMVNGPDSIFVERAGRIHQVEGAFSDEAHLRRTIDKIVGRVGRRVDESSPMVDARLPDGSRVNAIIPPLAIDGSLLTIRKFSADPYRVEDLIGFGTMSRGVADFLEKCVRGKLNILVSGGTGAGKTTTLNVLSSFIPSDERIVTIEDAAELQLHQEHVLRLESRPPNIEGKGEVTIRDLVRNALRMRPDRIVVGEVRDAAALDMLQAMNTGHDGSICTVHANTPRDVLSRVETMVLMAGVDLPMRAIREQVSSAVDLIVHQTRFKDGTRHITHVTEVVGMEGDVITLQDVFLFDHGPGFDDEGHSLGTLKSTGLRPKFLEKLAASGVTVDPTVFAFEMFR